MDNVILNNIQIMKHCAVVLLKHVEAGDFNGWTPHWMSTIVLKESWLQWSDSSYRGQIKFMGKTLLLRYMFHSARKLQIWWWEIHGFWLVQKFLSIVLYSIIWTAVIIGYIGLLFLRKIYQQIYPSNFITTKVKI